MNALSNPKKSGELLLVLGVRDDNWSSEDKIMLILCEVNMRTLSLVIGEVIVLPSEMSLIGI